jgi:hypothetical protein
VIDASGSGVLRLTSLQGGQSAMLLYNTALATSEGLDIAFSLAECGGIVADGLSFFVKDGGDADTTPGAIGGGLGYAAQYVSGGALYASGIHAALLGVGFDKWGSFSQNLYDGPTCGTSIGPGQVGSTVVVRGTDIPASPPMSPSV